MFSCAVWWFSNYYRHADNQIFTLNSTVVCQIFTHIGAEALQTLKPLASLTVSKQARLCIMIHCCLLFCDFYEFKRFRPSLPCRHTLFTLSPFMADLYIVTEVRIIDFTYLMYLFIVLKEGLEDGGSIFVSSRLFHTPAVVWQAAATVLWCLPQVASIEKGEIEYPNHSNVFSGNKTTFIHFPHLFSVGAAD